MTVKVFGALQTDDPDVSTSKFLLFPSSISRYIAPSSQETFVSPTIQLVVPILQVVHLCEIIAPAVKIVTLSTRFKDDFSLFTFRLGH